MSLSREALRQAALAKLRPLFTEQIRLKIQPAQAPTLDLSSMLVQAQSTLDQIFLPPAETQVEPIKEKETPILDAITEWGEEVKENLKDSILPELKDVDTSELTLQEKWDIAWGKSQDIMTETFAGSIIDAYDLPDDMTYSEKLKYIVSPEYTQERPGVLRNTKSFHTKRRECICVRRL